MLVAIVVQTERCPTAEDPSGSGLCGFHLSQRLVNGPLGLICEVSAVVQAVLHHLQN